MQARALRDQHQHHEQQHRHVPWPAKLSTLDEDEDEEPDWHQSEAAHNYDSETEQDIVFDLHPQLDPDEGSAGEEEDANLNGSFYEGFDAAEIEQLFRPPGTDTIVEVAAGGAFGFFLLQNQTCKLSSLVSKSKFKVQNQFRILKF